MTEFHTVEINDTEFTIPTRYQSLEQIGGGAFGQVCSATDTSLNVKVAIKKLVRPFQNSRFACRTFRELRLLKHMNHRNVLGLLNVFSPNYTTMESFNDIYFVTPFMDYNLAKVVEQSTNLTDDHLQYIMYQLFSGFKYIHSAGIIHRDLKPGNIVINENCDLKIIDFGAARVKDLSMTGYVATRYYRSPEMLFNDTIYTEAVDVWSLGCILGELILGRVLFPGKDTFDQINVIMEVTGSPTDKVISKIAIENVTKYMKSLGHKNRQDFKEVFKGASRDAIDLLERILELDWDKRITVDQAISHPYFQEYHNSVVLPTSTPFDASYDNMQLPVEAWKKLVREEIATFTPNQFQLDSLHQND